MNIPNFVDMKVIDQDGFFTPTWKIIMQQLLTELQKNAGNEGLVAPSQDAVGIGIIESTQFIGPVGPEFVCQFGTFLYDTTNKVVKVALDNAGAPQFHQVVTL